MATLLLHAGCQLHQMYYNYAKELDLIDMKFDNKKFLSFLSKQKRKSFMYKSFIENDYVFP